MIIKPNWRILTIGDGDLSFSLSLWQYHQPSSLWATIFDNQHQLAQKYGLGNFNRLINTAGCHVLSEVDINQLQSWQQLPRQAFDVVIFQFPLVPALPSKDDYQTLTEQMSVNTLNRALLRQFLTHAHDSFLDPQGPQLAYISSKDVKPYSDWDIERAVADGLGIHYLGSSPFSMAQFPGYRMRNVDRPGWVKETAARTYVWSGKPHLELVASLEPLGYQRDDCCGLCRRGPFANDADRQAHERSKRHRQLTEFDKQWQQYLRQH
ncbi:DUF2431 domain-containing protein [Neiella marina]|uniref:DUF2431 domain-containing protein n=1 Tax=Neiella holothuriorum TaxID=2870530 RepID=A0ABS7EGT1_9GAMM|nr:class I SAM-dependent methyltransferase [Neiella holothuriorum]MBW8191123.1 DUF2431 domain-containing protein [Neiella holothuriorum]